VVQRSDFVILVYFLSLLMSHLLTAHLPALPPQQFGLFRVSFTGNSLLRYDYALRALLSFLEIRFEPLIGEQACAITV
jgi:hypothetical protein